jgi:ABC-type phosphonate transport system ATPase subunit
MPAKLIQLSGIGKTFGPTRVLEDVSFDLFAGEVFTKENMRRSFGAGAGPYGSSAERGVTNGTRSRT